MDSETYVRLNHGAYTVKLKNGEKIQGEPEVGMITIDHTLVLPWGYYSSSVMPIALIADLIEWVRPLERQGGISGAMYWGEAIR